MRFRKNVIGLGGSEVSAIRAESGGAAMRFFLSGEGVIVAKRFERATYSLITEPGLCAYSKAYIPLKSGYVTDLGFAKNP